MVWMNFAHLFLGLHNSYINLSIFSIIFCHISMTACHMMSKMMIWAIGPMAYVPTKFHWDILKNEGILTTTTTTTTTSKIIITRGTVQGHSGSHSLHFVMARRQGITRGTVQGHSGSHSLHFVMARRQGIMKIEGENGFYANLVM